MIAKSWFGWCWQWQIGGCVAIFGTLLVGGGESVNAQIVPDNTLGAESSVITPNVNIRGIPSDRIDGGAIRGVNLFHSFEQYTLDRNNRVDINATGNLASGNIALPNTTFIQNSLNELPENRIDTDRLLASSCIVRRDRPTRGSFTVTGTGGLPQRPGDVQMSDFPTVDVETLPSDTTSSNTNPNRSWQKGDPIVEPQGVYRLPNGKLVMSRECY